VILYLAKCIDGAWMHAEHAAVNLADTYKHLRLRSNSLWVVFAVDTGQITAQKICQVWNRALPQDWKRQSWRIHVDGKSVLHHVDGKGADAGPLPSDPQPEED
jgi:hypothetical protein